MIVNIIQCIVYEEGLKFRGSKGPASPSWVNFSTLVPSHLKSVLDDETASPCNTVLSNLIGVYPVY